MYRHHRDSLYRSRNATRVGLLQRALRQSCKGVAKEYDGIRTRLKNSKLAISVTTRGSPGETFVDSRLPLSNTPTQKAWSTAGSFVFSPSVLLVPKRLHVENQPRQGIHLIENVGLYPEHIARPFRRPSHGARAVRHRPGGRGGRRYQRQAEIFVGDGL